MDGSISTLRGNICMKEIFENLFIEKKSNMIRTAYTILRNEEDANDALQEAYYEAIKHIDQLKDKKLFVTWFYRILINKCNKIAKSKVITYEMKPNYDWVSNENLSEEVENRIFIEGILQKLSKEHREIIVLKYMEDFTLTQISEILNIPTGTTKSRLSYAIGKVREYLRKGEYNGV